MSLCMYVMPDTCLSGTGFGVRFESFSGVQIEAISGVQNEVPTPITAGLDDRRLLSE